MPLCQNWQIKMKFTGNLHNSKLDCGGAIRNYMEQLPDGRYSVEVKEAKSKRSLQQNNYRWGVVIPTIIKRFDEGGQIWTPEEVNYLIKKETGMYIEYKQLPSGKFQEIVVETRGKSKATFEEFMEKVRAWAAQELLLTIPMPNEELE